MRDGVIVTTIGTNPVTQAPSAWSWGLLWAGFVVATVVAAWQSTIRPQPSPSSTSGGNDGEREGGGDISRRMFYKLLVVALLSRTIFLPPLILTNSDSWQLVADTLPLLCFASAWAWLVQFFVQLVNTASGAAPTVGNLVLHITAYCVFALLIITYLYQEAAAVLLYALLCCVYAALLGTWVYFCPKLMSMLGDALQAKVLMVRLWSSCTVGFVVFLGKTIELAAKVVAPPHSPHLWFTCGLLELLPTVVLLILMHPSTTTTNSTRDSSHKGNHQTTNNNHAMKRTPSGGSTSTMGSKSRSGETATLLKPTAAVAVYGSSMKEGP